MNKRKGDLKFPQEDIAEFNTICVRGKNAAAMYHSHDYLCFGDYVDNSYVGEANVRSLQEELETEDLTHAHRDYKDQVTIPVVYCGVRYVLLPTYRVAYDLPEAFIIDGAFASQRLYIREDLCMPYLNQLDQYACLDEDFLSDLERDEFDKAWESSLFRDTVHDTLRELQREIYPNRGFLLEFFHHTMDHFLEMQEFKDALYSAVMNSDYGVEYGRNPYIPHASQICMRVLQEHGLVEIIEAYYMLDGLETLCNAFAKAQAEYEQEQAMKPVLEKGKADYEEALFS